MVVSPRNILAGIGALSRENLALFLAFFNNAKASKLLFDQALDKSTEIGRWVSAMMRREEAPTEPDQKIKRFEQRVETDSRNILQSKSEDADLRLQLWNTLRVCFDLPVTIPLSTVLADRKAAELAMAATEHYRENSGIVDQFKRIFEKFRKDQKKPEMQFEDIVRKEAVHMIADAMNEGNFSEEEQRKITAEFRKSLENLPSDIRDEAVENALRSGDKAVIGMLTSTGSAVGLVAAVDIAGFSAYILAAKVASIIPLLGAKTAVSLLAVLSSPWLIPIVAGTVIIHQGKKIRNNVREYFATSLTIQLAILGFQDHENNFNVFMDEIRCAVGQKGGWHPIQGLITKKYSEEEGGKTLARINEVQKEYPEGLPVLPDSSGVLALSQKEEDQSTQDLFQHLLFPDKQQQHKDNTIIATSVAGVSLLDAVYNALVIDPEVIAAADFSRKESIRDIFEFSGFAAQTRAMDEAAREGSEAALRGYTAEMYVASRLSGHQVSLPENPNNPGVDLIVDGEPFQVKCYESSDNGVQALRDHFERYPDTSVFINSEVASKVDPTDEWADKVVSVEGFDFSTVDGMVEQSLSSAAKLQQEYAPMLYVLMINSTYQLYRWRRGLVSLKDLPFEIALTGAARGTLSLAGGITGHAIGGLLFGPAGMVILPPLFATASIFQAPVLMEGMDRLLGVQQEWEENVSRVARPFRRALVRVLERKRELIDRKLSVLAEAKNDVAGWVRRKLEDERLSLVELRTELFQTTELKPLKSAQAMLRIMTEASVLPVSVQPQLKEFIYALGNKPSRRVKVEEKWRSLRKKDLKISSKKSTNKAWQTYSF